MVITILVDGGRWRGAGDITVSAGMGKHYEDSSECLH